MTHQLPMKPDPPVTSTVPFSLMVAPPPMCAAETGEVAVAREQRKPAAILAADVAGYSRLMGRDESGTLARHDGQLVEFASAVDVLSA
jgi:class 3 adenylate cyclase